MQPGLPKQVQIDDLLNPSDGKIKQEFLRIVAQFLGEEGYQAAKMVLVDEANLRMRERDERGLDFMKLRKAILGTFYLLLSADGDWAEIEKLAAKPLVKNHKSFMYQIYKTQYLEYIDHHETQKAFTHLIKRVKPLEHFQTTPNEFYDLCYLLTAKSIQEVAPFKTWEGISASRERLVEQLENMMELDTFDREDVQFIPPGRLVYLVKQAVAYQMEFARYRLQTSPKIKTILQDYTCTVIPNRELGNFKGHSENVKCVAFVGEKGERIISGSSEMVELVSIRLVTLRGNLHYNLARKRILIPSDNTCRIWDSNSTECLGVLKGHTGRIWGVSCDKNGLFSASASGDGTIKIWNLNSMDCSATFLGHTTDVYSVQFHPIGKHVASGGYDRVTRLFDIEKSKAVKTFSGHQLAISKVVFSPLGNLIVTCSKDSTIKFWDIISGLCIKTLSSHLSEVTSIEMNANGTMLLSSSKDNSNRLWDVRMLRPIRKFKGHQNTSKNFISASFAGDSLVIGGSEDGLIYIWDSDQGDLIQRLEGHDGVVYNTAWNGHQNLFASCSDDKLVKTWHYDFKSDEG